MQPFIVAGTIAAAALLVVVSSPALLQGTPGAASHLASLLLHRSLCFWQRCLCCHHCGLCFCRC